MSRKNRTVDVYAAFSHNFKRPRLAFTYRKSRSAEATDRLASYILKQLHGRFEVTAEGFASLLPYQLMIHRVRAYFVFFSYAAYNIRIFPGHPSYNEERSFRVRFFQYAEYTLHIFIDTDFVVVPLLFGARGVVVQKVEPFLHVKCQDIHLSKFLSGLYSQASNIGCVGKSNISEATKEAIGKRASSVHASVPATVLSTG